MQRNVGIRGLGVFMPEQVRSNDWWPKHVVAGWTEKAAQRPPVEPRDDAERLVQRAMAEVAHDPFRGAVERHVMDADMSALDMEIEAARRAIADSDIPLAQIDLLLLQSSIPDHLATNTAVSVHAALGLPSACFALMVEAACNGFQLQVSLAEAMIASGRARHALLVQSCSVSRILDYDQAYSAWFGDGATAVMLGPVSPGRGLLAAHHVSDGELGNTLVAGVPDAPWFGEGRNFLYPINPRSAYTMTTRVPTYAQSTILPALAQAKLQPLDVDFYAGHQAFPWYRRVTQEFVGMTRARSFDTFASHGSLFSANLPLVLARGRERGLLHDGDIVVTHSGGSGLTYSSLVLRWGR